MTDQIKEKVLNETRRIADELSKLCKAVQEDGKAVHISVNSSTYGGGYAHLCVFDGWKMEESLFTDEDFTDLREGKYDVD